MRGVTRKHRQVVGLRVRRRVVWSRPLGIGWTSGGLVDVGVGGSVSVTRRRRGIFVGPPDPPRRAT